MTLEPGHAGPTRRRVRNRLLLPAAIVAACLTALAGVRAWQLRAAQIELQKARALQLVTVGARALDETIAETRTLLVSLGELLDPNAPIAVNNVVLQRIFRAAPVPYANLWIADTNGHALGAARLPAAGQAAFAIGDRHYFRAAIQSRQFTVGDIVASRVLPGHPRVITFAMPVVDTRTRAVRAVVGASIAVDSLEAVRTARSLPAGSVLAILDSSGTVLYRTLDVENWIGRRFALAKGRLDDYAVRQGVGAGVSADGTERLTGFHTTERAPWILFMGIPSLYTLDVVRNEFLRDLGLGLIITLIVLALGFASTVVVVTPIESLTRDARAIAGGSTVQRSTIDSNDEIGDLARAFNQMADTVVTRNAELKASQEQLLHAQKMDALGSFAGGIAHDFNNYLASIVAHAELADFSLPANHPAHRDVAEILASATRAADLTRQILVFSRKQVVEHHNLDLNGVVRDIERMLKRLLGEGIELHVHYAAAPVAVHADQGQLEQVLVNLVANARDAMPEGGRVTITIASVAVAPEDPRRLDGAQRSFGQLTVRDEGTGIPQELLDRVFDPFFSTKARGLGTGLGLAIAFSIVQQSGGRLSVESTPDVGTTFTVLLPIATGAIRDVVVPAPVRIAPSGRARILLAEDNAAVRSSCERTLARAGYSVVAAADGPSALHQMRSQLEQFDLLLSDVVMPGMSGSDLARRVKELQPDIAVLFMSGYADDDVVLKAVAVNAATCLAKPFTARALCEAVESALGQRASTFSA